MFSEAIKTFSGIKISREGALALVVAAASAYLMLVNLDYVSLWHDEGTNAFMAKSLARDGTISGWDGRNLLFGTALVDAGQYAIDRDLNLSFYPPWPALPSALGLLVFGGGEFALRFPHALLGVLCLPVFYWLLLLNFPGRSRLRLFAFALFALSPIVILYARQGRYYPDAMLFTLLSFYCFQRFRLGGGAKSLCGLCVFTILNFLNHFAIGFGVAASLALWHVLYFRRETTPRRWLQFAAAGGITAAACGGYLLWSGVVGGDPWREYGSSAYEYSWAKRRLYLAAYYFRDWIKFGWLPLWVALWWLWFASRGARIRFMKFARPQKNAPPPEDAGDKAARQWAMFAVLLFVIASAISVQPAHGHGYADMRYLVAALPFTLLMCAACADWLWAKNRAAGGALLAVLIFSNFAGFPFLRQGILCKADLHIAAYTVEEAFVLPALAREIHAPRASGTGETVAYLREHAAQDDTVFVHPRPDYSLLLYYLSDKLIFCCGLPEDTPLPKDKIRALGAPLLVEDASPPKWVVSMNNTPPPGKYRKVFVSEAVGYPVHRPEIEFRCMGESSPLPRAQIYRRIDS